MSEHILLTGGAGFIGTALTNHLNEHGYETSVVDHHFSHAASQKSVRGDLLHEGAFTRALDATNPDRVIHLAAQVGRMFGEDDVRHSIRSNAEMTTVVAMACAAREIPMVYTSTSEIYGDQGDHICHEERGPFGLPHNLYGLSKKWGEETCLLYNKNRLLIWRPSMPYGPGAPPGRGRRAMDNMLWQAHHRMPITVHRGAERSWCWLGDVVRAMRLTIEDAKQFDNQNLPRAYNIGRDDDPRSMLEIAQMACEIAGASEDLIEVVDPPGKQTVVKRLDTGRVRLLGWEPEVELEEGMQKVYEWIKQFDKNGVMYA